MIEVLSVIAEVDIVEFDAVIVWVLFVSCFDISSDIILSFAGSILGV